MPQRHPCRYPCRRGRRQLLAIPSLFLVQVPQPGARSLFRLRWPRYFQLRLQTLRLHADGLIFCFSVSLIAVPHAAMVPGLRSGLKISKRCVHGPHRSSEFMMHALRKIGYHIPCSSATMNNKSVMSDE